MKNILIVDDSRIMRNIVKSIFSQLGIPSNYLEASNGKKAMDLLHSNKIDLVLLDWNMPELSGIDFLTKVRAMAEYTYEKLPIIMVTSEAARYNIVEALKNGATDYIIKPINEKIFAAKIAELNLR
jgi:two-component system chemotaxis response regulator CheY